jgi:hypothetical protein
LAATGASSLLVDVYDRLPLMAFARSGLRQANTTSLKVKDFVTEPVLPYLPWLK